MPDPYNPDPYLPHWWTGGTLLQDFRGQMSWGRLCSAVALGMSVKLSFAATANVPLIVVWLGVATGTYTASKITEMVTAKRVTETGGVR
jgi:hypothetical protein